MQHLISAGSFGCVYSPTILCNGNFSTAKSQQNKITKLQIANFNALNEDNLGKYIKSNVHHYTYLFGVLTMKCKQKKILSMNLHKKIQKECPILKDKNPNNNKDKDKDKDIYNSISNEHIVLLEGNKIKGVDIINDIILHHSISLTKDKHVVFLSYFVNTYSYLLNSIRILNQHHIVHMDLKSDNILMDMKKKVPIIIDFGISFFSHQVNNDILNEIFYIYAPEYILWCPEIHFLNYIIHERNKLMNESKEEIIKTFVEDIMYENTIIFNYIMEGDIQVKKHASDNNNDNNNNDNNNLKAKYKKNLIQYLREIFDNTIHLDNPLKLYESMSMYSKTWDMYSISLLFLKLFRHPKIYFKYNIDTSYTNEPVEIVYNKLIQSLSSDPRERPKVEEMIYVMDILYQNTK